ncbi:VOC family protein [Paraburkholderia antibiotica]|uniref:VOC family protein n=1 Tax=Paraburkholderia antibiotica TaxID=2728839 RepID=A0A7X9X2G4_9BURK|nr:VOC family protein [Paraburkholderia antibiotica]NML30223.1 VOC family protein [Paraburkholderia antibiotica]
MSAIHEVYPYLRVRNAAQAIEFYTRAFGGVEQFRLTEPSGRIGHAEVKIGPAIVMLSDEYPEHGMLGPGEDSSPCVLLHIHCDDVDRLFAQAVQAGASVVRPLTDHFYGERSATVRDPFGHQWMLGAQIEALTPEEMQRRYTALFDQ